MATRKEISEKLEAISMLSDIYKDVNGIRPRGVYDLDAMTLDEIYAETESLYVVCSEQMESERVYQEACVELFKSLVNKTIILGAGDEKTALKWLFDAHVDVVDGRVDYFDFEQFLFNNGIINTKYGEEVLKVIKEPYVNYKA